MIEEKLKGTTLIIFELEYLKADLISVMNKESAYFKNVVEKSSSFYRIYRNSYKLFVIELAKIIDSKEHFSLLSLVNYIITHRKTIVWKREEIQIERLESIKEEIIKIQNLHLKDIKDLRDKFYAHTDKNRHEIEITFTLNQGWEILKEIRKLFEEIALKLNNQTIMFSVSSNLINEMVLLQRYKMIEKLIISKLKEHPNIGELQPIRDIIQGKKKE
jgi:hypothetical protein